MEQTILVIEDERDLRELLAKALGREGFRVVVAADGEIGLVLFKKHSPVAIVLDLMLPGISGEDVCRQIRRESRVPILMLSAKSSETDRVVGLELGADDYVTKPFSQRELTARVRGLIRRAAPVTTAGQPARVEVGDLVIDPLRFEASVSGKPLGLTHREFLLLKYFGEHLGQAVSREDLLEKVWGYRRAAELDTRTVDQHVTRLRGKLAGEARRLVTVKGVGYRLESGRN